MKVRRVDRAPRATTLLHRLGALDKGMRTAYLIYLARARYRAKERGSKPIFPSRPAAVKERVQ